MPHLGALPLRKLTPQHLSALYATLSAELAPASIAHLHRILHSALAQAVQWRLLAFKENRAATMRLWERYYSGDQPLGFFDDAIREKFGHRSPAMTLAIYAHLMPGTPECGTSD